MAEEKKSKKEKEDEGAAEAAAAAAAAGSKSRKLMIIGGLVAAVLLVGAPVAYFTLSKKSVDNEALASDAAHEGGGEHPAVALNEDEYDEGEEPLGAFFPLDSFVVNLQGGRYLRCQIQLEFSEREVPKRFFGRLVLVRDAVIALLSRKSESELGNENGKNALKTEVKDIVNEVLKRQEIKQVYFTQFVIQ